MDLPTDQPTPKRRAMVALILKYGAIMGLAFCAYTLFMWLTELDTAYLRYGQYLDMVIIALPVTVIFLALNTARNQFRLKLLDRLAIAVGVGLVSYVIYHPFLYVYHEFINPDWYASVIALQRENLASTGASQEEIETTVTAMQARNAAGSGVFSLAPFIASVLVVPGLIALLSLLFIRNRKDAISTT